MELDLALDREGVVLQASDSSDLLDETVWLQQLERWLNNVCGDTSLDCPTLVRSAEELSLGLRFTDDANIADLNRAWRQKTGPTDVLSFATLDDAYDAVCALSSVPGYFHFGCTSIIERDGCAYESEADMMARGSLCEIACAS